ncbi:hypothetical protein E1B28_002812 [Marasmius oreades]|uniref:Uncharacterized protein n=1 Tax=Marasmius oreades TaxID=181124 RepID=A0A9P7RNT6_9AGAR|nr:uncharacterized protein E1B28_002812 [Marasmius oreades]KAG7086892.1 hypothetical protein E1B28_002812 [Marasmius oreades]
MNDGRMAVSNTRPPHDLAKPLFSFDLVPPYKQKQAFVWLAQAFRVFSTLNVPPGKGLRNVISSLWSLTVLLIFLFPGQLSIVVLELTPSDIYYPPSEAHD